MLVLGERGIPPWLCSKRLSQGEGPQGAAEVLPSHLQQFLSTRLPLRGTPQLSRLVSGNPLTGFLLPGKHQPLQRWQLRLARGA